MGKLIGKRAAAYTIIIIISHVVLFHLLIITGVIPFAIVWGGRLQSEEQMIRFETASILINLIMIFIVAAHVGLFRLNINKKLTTFLLWVMTILFILNTLGNILSNNQMEMIIFTPLTFVLALLCLRLASNKKKQETH